MYGNDRFYIILRQGKKYTKNALKTGVSNIHTTK